MDSVVKLDWARVEHATDEIAKQAKLESFDTIVAVMRGGLIPARILASKLGVPNIVVWNSKRGRTVGTLGHLKGKLLVVDDISDTGKTMKIARGVFEGAKTAALVGKSSVDFCGIRLPERDKRWIVFPWEGASDKVGVRQSQ
jgi:hypoxanthine phosphoribosyltransferase